MVGSTQQRNNTQNQSMTTYIINDWEKIDPNQQHYLTNNVWENDQNTEQCEAITKWCNYRQKHCMWRKLQCPGLIQQRHSSLFYRLSCNSNNNRRLQENHIFLFQRMSIALQQGMRSLFKTPWLLLLPYQVPTQLSNIAPREGYQVREVIRGRKVRTDDDG